MSDVIDFIKFKAMRRLERKPESALQNCLLHDTLVDLTAVVDCLEAVDSGDELNLSQYDKDQLDYLAMLANEFLDHYEALGFNEVKEESDD